MAARSIFAALLLLIVATCVFATEQVPVQDDTFHYTSPRNPQGDSVVFVETFDDPEATKRWHPSAASEFTGDWSFSEGKGAYNFTGDKFLIAENKARRHAISTRLPKILDPTNKTLVVQYEVQLQNGQECGGAYIKLLTKDDSRADDGFDNTTPYTIMFGPDKCGTNDKIHFIFRHQNPITKEIEEKHLKAAPQSKSDKLTHLYTLVVRPDNSYMLMVDRSEVARGSLLLNFSPSVNPPKEINDPEDIKPSDWVDAKTIPDPDAVRPEEWDDRKTIEDPTAEKPADWSDEDDGDWERPEIPNPDYQGEWAAPQHPNPAYKGEWAPRKIPNPGYFEDSHPHNFNLIDGIGIELWTMSEGVSFNNILITYDEKIAEVFAEQTWRPRFEEERKIAAKNAPAPDSEIMKVLRKGLEVAKEYIDLAIVFANEQPIAFAASVAAGFIPVIVAVYFCGIGSSPAPKKKAPKKKPVAPEEKPLIGSEKIEELPEEETTTLRKRKN